MGTLFEQPPRKMRGIEERDLTIAIDLIKTAASKTNTDIKTVAEIYKAEVLNRYIDCYVDNGNNFDEQMSGIGKILLNISHSIEKISPKVDSAR